MALVEIRDVHKTFFRGSERIDVFSGLTMDVEQGSFTALMGPSGSGKSTLARILTLIDPATSGELLIEGEPVDITRHGVSKDMRRKVQMVFQNPYGSLNPRQKIGDVLGEPLAINTNLSAADRAARAHQMLQKVGLGPEHFNRYPHMFSGGQRQRIAIARALMLNPSLLVLDEPVSALDLSVQAQILNLLADLQDEFQLTYVFISHDLSVVRYIADDVMVMYLGDVVEQGTREELFSNPQHPYTKALFAATPRADVEHIKARLARRIAESASA